MQKKKYWYMTWMLAKTDVILRYHGSFLGILWVIIKPLALFSVLALVFGSIFSQEPDYTQQLFLGLLLWWYFYEGSMSALMSLLHKGYVLKKLPIPHERIVLASIFHAAMLFFIEVMIFIGYLVIMQHQFSFVPTLVGLLFACSMITCWNITIGLLFSAATVRVRDIPQIWEVLLTVGFYAVPVLYPLSLLPPSIAVPLSYIPFTEVLTTTKAMVLSNLFTAAELTSMVTITLGSLMVLLVSFVLFTFSTKRVNEYL